MTYPSIKVGLLNVTWDNGSREKPLNLIPNDVIANFDQVNKKVNWIDDNSGFITLNGHYNYLIFREMEYFFLTKSKVIDIEKNTFVYSVTRDYWMTLLSDETIKIKGCLTKTLNEKVLWDNLQLTKGLLSEPNSQEVFQVSTDKSCIECTLSKKMKITNFNDDQFGSIWMPYANDLKAFFESIKRRNNYGWINDRTAQNRLVAYCKLSKLKTWNQYIADLIKDWLNDDPLSLTLSQVKNLEAVNPFLNKRMTELHSLKAVFSITKSKKSSLEDYAKLLEGSSADNLIIKNLDFSTITSIELLNYETLDILDIKNKSILDLPVREQETRIDMDTRFLVPKAYGREIIRGITTPSYVWNLKYMLNQQKIESSGLFSSSYEANISYFLHIEKSTEFGFILFKIHNYLNLVNNEHLYWLGNNTELKIVDGFKLPTSSFTCDVTKHLSNDAIFVDSSRTFNLSFSEAYSYEILSNGLWSVFLTKLLWSGQPNKPFNNILTNFNSSLPYTQIICWVDENNQIWTEAKQLASTDEKNKRKVPYLNPINENNSSKIQNIKNNRTKLRNEIELTSTIDSWFIDKGDLVWDSTTMGFFKKIGHDLSHVEFNIDSPTIAIFCKDNFYLNGVHRNQKNNTEYQCHLINSYPINVSLNSSDENIIQQIDIKQKDNDLYKPYLCVSKQILNEKQHYIRYQSSITNSSTSYNYSKFASDLNTLAKNLVQTIFNRSKNVFASSLIGWIHYSIKNDGIHRDLHYFEANRDWPKDRNGNLMFVKNVSTQSAYWVRGYGPEHSSYGTIYVWSPTTGEEATVNFNISNTMYESDYQWFRNLNSSEYSKTTYTYTQPIQGQRECDWKTFVDLREIESKLRFPKSSLWGEFRKKLAAKIGLENANDANGYLDQLLSDSIRLANPFSIDVVDNKYTYIDKEYIQQEEVLTIGNHSKKYPKTFLFQLRTAAGVLFYALIRWAKDVEKPLIELVLADNSLLSYESYEDIKVSNNALLSTQNLYQAINQKNYLYIYGQRFPINTKLVNLTGNCQYKFNVTGLKIADPISNKYRVYFEGEGGDILDTKIIIPKKELKQSVGPVDVMELENYKLLLAEKEERKKQDYANLTERERILNQNLNNRKEDNVWDQSIGATNVSTGILGSGVSAAVSFMANPLLGGFQIAQSVGSIATAGANLANQVRQNNRAVEQDLINNAKTIELQRAQLDTTHKYDELREWRNILQMSNTVRNAVANDADEVEALNQLITNGSDIAIIHQKPEGILLDYITQFYDRYGVDILLNKFVLKMSDLNEEKTHILQFSYIDEMSITDLNLYESIKNTLINGIRLKKIDYEISHTSISQLRIQHAEKIKRLQAEQARLKKEAEELRLKEYEIEQRLKIEAEEKYTKSHEELLEIKKDVEEKLKHITQLETVIEDQKHWIKNIQLDLDNEKAYAKVKESDIVEYQQKVDEIKTSCEAIKTEKEKLNTELETEKNKLNEEKAKTATLSTKVRQLETDLQKCKESGTSEDSQAYIELNTRYQNLNNEKNNLIREKNSLSREKLNLQSQLSSTRSAAEQLAKKKIRHV